MSGPSARGAGRGTTDAWTPTRIERLKQMWEVGDTVSVIAAALKISNNSVVGKVHRLKLPGRPSPIGVGRSTQAGKVAKQRPSRIRPPRTLARAARVEPTVLSGVPAVEITPPASSVPPPPPPPPPPVPRMTRASRSEPCCWPIEQPGRPRFRYCEAPSAPGRQYCSAHCSIAFVPRPTAATRSATASA